jgi:hypothetical protein
LTIAAMALPKFTAPALFIFGGATLFLLIVGIHNAWDSVTHIVVSGLPRDARDSDAEKSRGDAGVSDADQRSSI